MYHYFKCNISYEKRTNKKHKIPVVSFEIYINNIIEELKKKCVARKEKKNEVSKMWKQSTNQRRY